MAKSARGKVPNGEHMNNSLVLAKTWYALEVDEDKIITVTNTIKVLFDDAFKQNSDKLHRRLEFAGKRFTREIERKE